MRESAPIHTSMSLPDHIRTAMIIPASKKTFFNTNWKPPAAPLCAYDMLYHPPDYNPNAARSDRAEPKIIRKNIWDQVKKTNDSKSLQYGTAHGVGCNAFDTLAHSRLSGTQNWAVATAELVEFHKGIPSTTHFRHGRPKWKASDLPTKQFVRVTVKNQNPHMRIYNVLEWAVLINDGKPSLCD